MTFAMNTEMTKGDRRQDYGPSWQRGIQSPVGVLAHIDELQVDLEGRVEVHSAMEFLAKAFGGITLQRGDQRALRRELSNSGVNLDPTSSVGIHNLQAFGLPEKVTKGPANEMASLSKSLTRSLKESASPITQLSQEWGTRIGTALAQRAPRGGRSLTDNPTKVVEGSVRAKMTVGNALAKALPPGTVVT